MNKDKERDEARDMSKDDLPEGYDEGRIENMSLWDIANMEAGTDIADPSATDDTPYKNYGYYSMVSDDDSVVDTSSS